MKKYVALFGLSLVLSSPSLAQENAVDSEFISVMDSCTGLMSNEDLIKTSQELLKKGDETSDFFATNCIMIAAHKGDADAQYLLSKAYENGIGAPHSTVFAYKWAKIADLHGKEIPAEEFAKLESTMTVDDYRQSSTEISNYLQFEKRNDSKMGVAQIKTMLKDMNYENVSPEVLKAIQESAKNIDALFDVDSDKVDRQKTEASKLKRNIPNNADYESKRRDDNRMEYEARNEELERDRVSQSSSSEAKQQQEERRTSTGGKLPRSLDFSTDKFNPGFSAPTF